MLLYDDIVPTGVGVVFRLLLCTWHGTSACGITSKTSLTERIDHGLRSTLCDWIRFLVPTAYYTLHTCR